MSNWINWRIAVIRGRGLSSGSKGLALYLHSYMNDRHDMAWPSIATICGEMNYGSRSTPTKYLRELTEAGFLAKEKRFAKTTIYHATIPDSVRAEAVDNLQKKASSTESVLVQEMYSSSTESVTPVVQDVYRNNQENYQDKNQEGAFAPPSSVDKSAWQDFDGFRQSTAKLRKGWTDRAKQIASRKLEGLTPQQQRQCVEYSILGGYPGLYPERLAERQNLGVHKPQPDFICRRPNNQEYRQSPAEKAKAKAELERLEKLMAARKQAGG